MLAGPGANHGYNPCWERLGRKFSVSLTGGSVAGGFYFAFVWDFPTPFVCVFTFRIPDKIHSEWYVLRKNLNFQLWCLSLSACCSLHPLCPLPRNVFLPPLLSDADREGSGRGGEGSAAAWTPPPYPGSRRRTELRSLSSPEDLKACGERAAAVPTRHRVVARAARSPPHLAARGCGCPARAPGSSTCQREAREAERQSGQESPLQRGVAPRPSPWHRGRLALPSPGFQAATARCCPGQREGGKKGRKRRCLRLSFRGRLRAPGPEGAGIFSARPRSAAPVPLLPAGGVCPGCFIFSSRQYQ